MNSRKRFSVYQTWMKILNNHECTQDIQTLRNFDSLPLLPSSAPYRKPEWDPAKRRNEQLGVCLLLNRNWDCPYSPDWPYISWLHLRFGASRMKVAKKPRQDTSSRMMRSVRSDGEVLPPLCTLVSAYKDFLSNMTKRWSVGTPFFLLMPGESAVLPMSHQAFSLGSIALLEGSGTSVEDCDPTMPDPQCSARHREILHRFVSPRCHAIHPFLVFAKATWHLPSFYLKGLVIKWYSAIIILTSPIASMYGIFPYIYRKHHGWM